MQSKRDRKREGKRDRVVKRGFQEREGKSKRWKREREIEK